MEPVLPTRSPDKLDQRPSFRKPSNDAANRKYRRHSPLHGSDSSSSDDSPKRSRSPVYSLEDHTRISDRWRKDDGRELERDSGHHRSSRGGDSRRQSDRQSYNSSHDSWRHDDYSRHRRYADEEDRSRERSSRLGRESRSGMHSDRYDSHSDRSREHLRIMDKYSRERSDVEHRSKDKEREITSTEHHRHNDRDSDKVVSGSRHYHPSKDDIRTVDRDRHRDREAQDEKRDNWRSPGTYKNDHASFPETSKEYRKDSAIERDSGTARSKETYRNTSKTNCTGLDRLTEDLVEKRRNNDREGDKRKEKYSKEAEEERQSESRNLSNYRGRDWRNETESQNFSSKKFKLGHSEFDEKPSSGSKQVESAEKVTLDPISFTTNQTESTQDLNAAKVAAMKAAELVNRNLVGVSCMSTDQKKKLLWGNKNSPTEESSNRWDLHLFPDRERQEKFNKLMGVKGNVNLEREPDDKDVEKQKELQIDLEKQYTAGLRRRDGRTVGLGL